MSRTTPVRRPTQILKLVLLLALILGLCSLCAPAEAGAADQAPTWKAAAGSVVITPERSMWMAGYAARDKPSEGTAQDLFAKALVLEDARGTRLAIVTMDLIEKSCESR